MTTLLRRLFWLALLSGAGYACWTAWHSQNAASGAAAPEWPPLDTTASRTPAAPAGLAAVATREGDGAASTEPAGSPTRWVAPVDGGCAEGYPIKANDNSGIYHVPGGRFYDRTGPERCYATAEDAEADGYRPAKS